jgi:anti-sigma factor RsiW
MNAELVVMTGEDVSAFVDGELAREDRQDVAACARDDDRVACRIAAWQWQQGLLHAAFGAVADEPVPEALASVPWRAAPRC